MIQGMRKQPVSVVVRCGRRSEEWGLGILCGGSWEGARRATGGVTTSIGHSLAIS
jgi:hypothetical protein